VIGYAVDHFRIYNDGIESDQVRNKRADSLAFVENIECRLLPKRNLS